MYVSVVNMSKSCCFAFVLAVICLSLEADAQPTVDETTTCGSSTLEEIGNMVKVVVSNQQQNAKEISDLKTLLVSGSGENNATRLEEVVKEIKDELKDEMKDEIRRMKNTIASGCVKTNETEMEDVAKEIKAEIRDVKTLLMSGSGENNQTRLEEVVNMVRIIASNQQQNDEEIGELKTSLGQRCEENNETRLEDVVQAIMVGIESRIDLLKEEIKDVTRPPSSNTTDCDCQYVTTNPPEHVTEQSSKHSAISALVCKYLLCSECQMFIDSNVPFI